MDFYYYITEKIFLNGKSSNAPLDLDGHIIMPDIHD